MPALSVCCRTRGSARAAALLALLRPLADEIVVALDDRADATALGDVADRVLAYPYAEPVERPLPWLYRQCSGDWVLLVDDDEIPSGALLDSLPTLVRAQGVTHYFLPRRWLFPDRDHWLDQPPWHPDYQLRLAVNDLRLLRFPGQMHRTVEALGPARFLDAPVYHADLLLSSREEREEKAQRYERLAPGKRIAGRPLNEAFYLPELVEPPSLAGLPARDAELVAGVLDASPSPAEALSPRSRRSVSREEVDRFWGGRELRQEDYSALIKVVGSVAAIVACGATTVELEVENRGGAIWPWGADGRPEIRLSYRWFDRDGRVVAEGLRTPLPAELPPGGRELVSLVVQAPPQAGRHRLLIDALHEHVRWFGCETELEVEVLPRRRVAAIGPFEPAELAALERPLEPVLFSADPERAARRWAGSVAPALDRYLLDGLPEGRAAAAAVLVLRTAQLLSSARRIRRGREPRAAAEFLRALASCESAVVAEGGGRRRERAVSDASALAARTLGLRVRRPA
jgi:hypothetical protein